ncbi:MAG: hypothetical protein OS130_01975 [Thermodesulfobacteriota bacterium]|nr:MAG: hypothetical protein OS130_01975 [Thermodesulfobacteriota bacterium]
MLKFALDYLKEGEKEEQEKHHDIERSLRKALGDCQKKIENLNQMRMRELIDDGEYLTEKKKLLEEKIRLEDSVKSGSQKGEKAIQLTEEMFMFASQAKERFQNGSLEDKRSILLGLGSNFFLKNKKLFIQTENPSSSWRKD